MRKKVIGAVLTVGVIATAGVAWAAIQGSINTPSVLQFIATAGQPVNCQSGSMLELTIPDPVWDNTLGDYAVSTIDYSNVTSTCVNLGTADVILNITGNGPTSIASGSDLNISASSGTIVLNNPITFDDANNSDYNYLIRNE